jgi:hypothetical protein
VKVTGNAGPDLRFTARPRHGFGTATIGDVVRASGARFRARVIGGDGRDLMIVKDGVTVARVPVAGDDFTSRLRARGRGRWRLQLVRGRLIDTVSSPIWVEPGRGRIERARCGD